jgi:type IV pilus assembly protein PilF
LGPWHWWLLPGLSASAGSEIVTPSDETEVHRRARIRLELAANYFSMGQTSVALDEVKQAIATDPSYADAFNLRGLIYMRLNDLVLAEESFRRAAALRPQDPDVAHNYGWLLCQQRKFAEAEAHFQRALAQPTYQSSSRTLMAQGLCLEAAGKQAEAEQVLIKSYELDPGNPVVGYNLALLKHRRGDQQRAQFYIRRLNNSELANSQSLWLGIKVERALGNTVAMRQLGDQLHKRFPDSRELAAFEKGAFDD